MGKSGKTGVCMLLCALFLSGCGQAGGPDAIGSTTLSVSDKGSLTSYLVGDFAKDYYNLSELESMVTEEANAYNSSQTGGDSAVEVETVELLESDSSKVMIKLQYDSVDTYRAYNGVDLFYGTVEEAIAAGYPLTNVALTSVKDGSQAENGYLQQKASKQHILITEEPIVFYCPFGVTHFSAGAVLNKDGSVDMSGCEGTGIILMKK